MEESARRMDVERFDLIAVHNLQDWQVQLATLKDWKAQGKVRYIGITTSHGREHEALLQRCAANRWILSSSATTSRTGRPSVKSAAGRQARHRHHDQPAVPARRPVQQIRGRAPAATGSRTRLQQLGQFTSNSSSDTRPSPASSRHGQRAPWRTICAPTMAACPMNNSADMLRLFEQL